MRWPTVHVTCKYHRSFRYSRIVYICIIFSPIFYISMRPRSLAHAVWPELTAPSPRENRHFVHAGQERLHRVSADFEVTNFIPFLWNAGYNVIKSSHENRWPRGEHMTPRCWRSVTRRRLLPILAPRHQNPTSNPTSSDTNHSLISPPSSYSIRHSTGFTKYREMIIILVIWDGKEDKKKEKKKNSIQTSNLFSRASLT